jgi:hypothetical protein
VTSGRSCTPPAMVTRERLRRKSDLSVHGPNRTTTLVVNSRRGWFGRRLGKVRRPGMRRPGPSPSLRYSTFNAS